MTTTDFDRNQLLRQALQPASGCPPLAEMLDAHFAGTASPRAEELRLHAAACSACAIVDSVMDIDYAAGRITYHSADKMIEFVRANGLKVEWLIETHAHADHLSGGPYIQEKLGGKLAIGARPADGAACGKAREARATVGRDPAVEPVGGGGAGHRRLGPRLRMGASQLRPGPARPAGRALLGRGAQR